MNIKIKENPSITVVNCPLYAEQTSALYLANLFMAQISDYREKLKTSVNSCGYDRGDRTYLVWVTATGNIRVKKL